MSTVNENQLLRELQNEAHKWIMRTFPVRMNGGAADETEVRIQMNDEAEKWVQYNFEQRREGKEGTPSPDFHLDEEKPGYVPTVGATGTDTPDISDDEC